MFAWGYAPPEWSKTGQSTFSPLTRTPDFPGCVEKCGEAEGRCEKEHVVLLPPADGVAIFCVAIEVGLSVYFLDLESPWFAEPGNLPLAIRVDHEEREVCAGVGVPYFRGRSLADGALAEAE